MVVGTQAAGEEGMWSSNSSSTITSRFLRGGCRILGISSSSRLSFPRPRWGSDSCSKPSPLPLWSHGMGSWKDDFTLWCSPQNLLLRINRSCEVVSCPGGRPGLWVQALGTSPQQGRAGVSRLWAVRKKCEPFVLRAWRGWGWEEKREGVGETSGHCDVPSRRKR